MPWQERCTMSLRQEFLLLPLSGHGTIEALEA